MVTNKFYILYDASIQEKLWVFILVCVLPLPYWSVSIVNTIVNTIVSELSIQCATRMGLINALKSLLFFPTSLILSACYLIICFQQRTPLTI